MKRKPGRPIGTGTNGRTRYLTADERTRFMAQAKKSGAKADLIFNLVYTFAMRCGEITALSMADINMAARQLTIRGLKNGLVRTYDIPVHIEKKLKAWLRLRPDGPFLFQSAADPNRPMARIAVQFSFYRIARRAGVNGHSVHDLRHSAASELVAAGGNLIQIANWLRHRSPSSSERYLSDVDAKRFEAMAGKRLAG